MRFLVQLVLCFALVYVISSAVYADDLAMADNSNPYSSISERNIFALVPIPTNAPVVDSTPVDPPLKITPNGIMTLFGKLEVLFKVTTKAQPGQPPKDLSYEMGEGERQDDIAVTKIDDKAGIITFDNHGVVQELALVDAPNQTEPAGGGGGPGMNPGMSGGIPMPAAPGMRPGLIGRGALGVRGAADSSPSLSPATPSAPVVATATISGANTSQQTASEPMTAEEQIISIETQRAKWLDDGNPAAKILPPTPLTKQLTGENEAAGPPTPP